MKKLKLMLVDDQKMFAESLKMFLTNYAEDMEVITIASNGKEAVDFIAESYDSPDIVLMDVRMPVMDGVQAVEIIKKRWPFIKTIMLSTYDEDEYVRQALLKGASGYLLKDISPTELILSIRALNSGMIQISPSIAQTLVRKTYMDDSDSSSQNNDKNFEYLKTLTAREREIFTMLATGHDNEQIASSLSLSHQTVRNHVCTIYSKLGVKDRFEIIQLANKVNLKK